ncbi:MAG: enoyl-CoA hydratase-related protein [Pseudomonadota bacterium]
MAGSQSSGTQVRAQREGAVLTVTLSGPQSRNAMGPDVYEAVQAHLVEAGAGGDLRAVVLTGEGGFFSSGGHVAALRESAHGTLAEATTKTDRLNAMVRAILECPIPVVAAVEGGAAGAAVAAVLACDLIVAAEGARFSIAHVRVGLSPDGGLTHLLRAALPRQFVMELCLLGTPVAAERLAAAGVVNALVPPGAALAWAQERAQRLADGPPEAMACIKRLITGAPEAAFATHQEAEARAINRARFRPEAAEGLTAFLEKRAPRFHTTPTGRTPA